MMPTDAFKDQYVGQIIVDKDNKFYIIYDVYYSCSIDKKGYDPIFECITIGENVKQKFREKEFNKLKGKYFNA
jgi:hypothetical protein